MQAFILERYGASLTQQDVPAPEVGERDVLVRLSAAGVNHADERLRLGEFKQIYRSKLPLVVGSEFSGVVEAVGSAVRRFKPGMEVFAYANLHSMGAFAELIAIDEDHLAEKPSTTTMVEAASLPVNALTAWNALTHLGQLRSGQTVLIHGGSGGVGSIAIQLAKHLGARVATTASTKHADFARNLGADIVIDYRTEDFTELLTNVDLVLDTQGGETLERSLTVLRPGGTVINITGPPDPLFAKQAGASPLVATAVRALSSGIRRKAKRLGVNYRFLLIQPNGDQLRAIATLVDDGVIKPTVGQVFPFTQTPKALATLVSGGTHGKVIVSTNLS